jgi:hypothetical protein
MHGVNGTSSAAFIFVLIVAHAFLIFTISSRTTCGKAGCYKII